MEGSIVNQAEAASVSTIKIDKESFDSEKLPPKARYFTFEGLTPVSTVDDSREDRPDNAGREVSPLPRLKEHSEDRIQPGQPSPDDSDAPQKRRCWSLTLEEAPFDEDPIISPQHNVPRSCPNAFLPVKATPVRRMAPVDETPPTRPETPSDVTDTSLDQKAVAVEPAIVSPTPDAPVEPLPVPEDTVEIPQTPPATTKTMPSSLLDEAEEDDDEGLAAKFNEEIVMAPSDEIEDRKMIESNILREADVTEGCDVDICKHLVNSSNDICQGFSKFLSI